MSSGPSSCSCWPVHAVLAKFASLQGLAAGRADSSSLRPDPAAQQKAVLRLSDFHSELPLLVEFLPAHGLARLASAGCSLAVLVEAAKAARGASAGTTSLRILHVLEAQELRFVWSDGQDVWASGEDGWATFVGSALLGTGCHGRHRWELELVRHDGILAIGIGDQRMDDASFLGSPSQGKWSAWGWELDPRGGVEPILEQSAEQVCAPQRKFFPPVSLRPARGRRVVFGIHVGYDRAELELIVRLQERPDGPWSWHFLHSLPFQRPSHWQVGGRRPNSAKLQELRPVASLNIGAKVCVLRGEV